MTSIYRYGEFDGYELGVLSDGTPFATAMGLARLCDVDVANILRLGKELGDPSSKNRLGKISATLVEYDYAENSLYTKQVDPKGQEVNIYTTVYKKPLRIGVWAPTCIHLQGLPMLFSTRSSYG